jgi:hypothetical protein
MNLDSFKGKNYIEIILTVDAPYNCEFKHYMDEDDLSNYECDFSLLENYSGTNSTLNRNPTDRSEEGYTKLFLEEYLDSYYMAATDVPVCGADNYSVKLRKHPEKEEVMRHDLVKIEKLSIKDLLRNLLTSDFRGPEFKRNCLLRLLSEQKETVIKEIEEYPVK